MIYRGPIIMQVLYRIRRKVHLDQVLALLQRLDLLEAADGVVRQLQDFQVLEAASADVFQTVKDVVVVELQAF